MVDSPPVGVLQWLLSRYGGKMDDFTHEMFKGIVAYLAIKNTGCNEEEAFNKANSAINIFMSKQINKESTLYILLEATEL